MYDLFESQVNCQENVSLSEKAMILPGFAWKDAEILLQDVDHITQAVPFQTMVTPSGHKMSAQMSYCGDYRWVSDKNGYRYEKQNPSLNKTWSQIPESFLKLAKEAAKKIGFENYSPDACIINYYKIGAKMSLHQDKDEKDRTSPVISISLGLPATFLWGGDKRSDSPEKYHLQHGDVVVWGGRSRFRFHGVLPIKAGYHSILGEKRINITLRCVENKYLENKR